MNLRFKVLGNDSKNEECFAILSMMQMCFKESSHNIYIFRLIADHGKILALWYLTWYLKMTKTSIYNLLISKWLFKHVPILELADKLCNVLTAIFDGDYSKREAWRKIDR